MLFSQMSQESISSGVVLSASLHGAFVGPRLVFSQMCDPTTVEISLISADMAADRTSEVLSLVTEARLR